MRVTRLTLSRNHIDPDCEHGAPAGHAGLRRQIAKRIASAGCRAGPEDVVVTNGTMEAIALSLGVICKPGDTVLVESPTYFGILQLLEHMRLKIVEIPNRPIGGIDVDVLEYLLAGRHVAAAVLQSSFNNPTGATTPDEAKQRIVEILATHRVPLIEDDIYGDLHFGNERPKPFAAFAASGRVITCGSVSKSIALGFRIGWAISLQYAVEIARAKFCSSVASPSLQQHVVAQYLSAGGHDRHLRRVRETLSANMQRFIETIAATFPQGTRVSRPAGGVVLWLELPDQVDGLSLFQAALAEKIGIAPGIIFSARGEYAHYVRVSAGASFTAEVRTALQKLGALAVTARERPEPPRKPPRPDR